MWSSTKILRKLSGWGRLVCVGAWAFALLMMAACGGGGGGTGGGSGSTGPANAVVASQTVDAMNGGLIAINIPGNPLNGTVVTIPPGALGTSGSDTISVGYSNTLPGPLNPGAVAAGATIVSTTIQLTHTGTAPMFASAVQVTVPYDNTKVTSTDVPFVVYWDTSLNQYESVPVTDLDRDAGTITFNTKHFCSFEVALIEFKNLNNGQMSVPSYASGVVGSDIVSGGFSPSADGFQVGNFSSQFFSPGYGNGGVCYGMTSFSAWFFDSIKAGTNPQIRLYNNNLYKDSVFMSNLVEWDVTRELILQTFIDTFQDNINSDLPKNPATGQFLELSKVDYVTGVTLLSTLEFTNSPQLITLCQNRNYSVYPESLGNEHSVIVYGYNYDTKTGVGNFLIYDPNEPGLEKYLLWNVNSSTYDLSGYPGYSLFLFDGVSEHYSSNNLVTLLANAQCGWPDNKHFATITLTPITTQPSSTPSSPNTYVVDPNSDTINFSGTISGTLKDTSSAYYYINGNYQGCTPITNYISSTFDTLSLPQPLSIPTGQTSAELLIIIADSLGSGTAVPDISSGYAGFLRATLVLGQPVIVKVEGSASPQTDYIPPKSVIVGLAAEVTGAIDTSVTWSASGGTLSDPSQLNNISSITWTSPDAIGIYTVTATSNADPSVSGKVIYNEIGPLSTIISVTESPSGILNANTYGVINVYFDGNLLGSVTPTNTHNDFSVTNLVPASPHTIVFTCESMAEAVSAPGDGVMVFGFYTNPAIVMSPINCWFYENPLEGQPNIGDSYTSTGTDTYYLY